MFWFGVDLILGGRVGEKVIVFIFIILVIGWVEGGVVDEVVEVYVFVVEGV